MSRKAAERRAAPDSFVEANLWVVTRGRPYKPRFRAERSVVVVSGGGAVTADAEVAPPRSVHGARRPEPSVLSAPTRPMAAVLDAAACAEALFARTACEALYVLDYSPLARDMPSELASPYPGRVAKPASRLLRKLNPADAILAADGADAALALKLLPTLGDDVLRAAVVRHPHRIPPAGLRALVGAGALTARPADVACAPGGAPAAEADLRGALPAAVFREDADADADAVRSAFAAVVERSVRAVEAEDGVSGPPDWLMTDDTPVFYSKVTFEHDRRSKQIVQRVENVTDIVEAAISANAAYAAVTRADGDASGSRNRGEMDAKPSTGSTDAKPSRETDAKLPRETDSTGSTDYAKSPDSTGSSPSSVTYDARRPFHPGRLAATLRAHFSLALGNASRNSTEEPSDVAAAEAAVEAAEAAARAATAAEALAERLRAALEASADPVAVAAAASSAASAASASASASAAVSSARLLARLLSDSKTTSASVPGGRVSRVPAPSGPFTGVLRSEGDAWIASRPSTKARWTQIDPNAPNALVVECFGAWDADPADHAGCVSAERSGADLGETRTRIRFRGTDAMDREKLFAAMDACLLREDEQDETDPNRRDVSDPTFANTMEAGGEGADAVLPNAHLSEKENAEGDDEIVADAVEGEAEGDDEIVADAVIPSSSAAFRETVEPSASASGSPSGENAEASKPQASGKAKASVQFGGKVGVHRPEAFTAPPEGVDVKEFSEGTGHFYPKMPCLECGSPWWLGDDWDAECANCGEGADTYDDDMRPIGKKYKRRFEQFRELVDALDRGGGEAAG